MIAAPAPPSIVIPAKAGIQTLSGFEELPMKDWTPAFAGVTRASFDCPLRDDPAPFLLDFKLSVLILFPGVD
jgi:hypothetical protein